MIEIYVKNEDIKISVSLQLFLDQLFKLFNINYITVNEILINAKLFYSDIVNEVEGLYINYGNIIFKKEKDV